MSLRMPNEGMPSFEQHHMMLDKLNERLEGQDAGHFNDWEADFITRCFERVSAGYGVSPGQSYRVRAIYNREVGQLPGFEHVAPKRRRKKGRKVSP